MDRRNFLRTGGMAVLGSLAMPSLAMPGSVRGALGGADSKSAVAAAANHFGVTEADLKKVMAVALEKGGDYADLYFEHTFNNSVSLMDGKVNNCGSNIDFGMGVRVLSGDQSGYAYVEGVTLEEMLRAARTAARIASSGRAGKPVGLTEKTIARSRYAVATPWEDVGVKVKRSKGMSGKPITSKPVYGYLMDEDENFIIDEEAAPVVRQIYSLCLAGNGPTKIARMLTEQQIPTPGTLEYRRTGSTRRYHPGYECKWATNTVVHLLENREYTGCLVNFKTEKPSYKLKHSIENPPEKQAVFENHHEPIIDRETWERVQELRKQRKRPNRYDEVGLFSGILFCADCGSVMYQQRYQTDKRKQDCYICGSYKKRTADCTAHFIRTDLLTAGVLSNLRKVTSYAAKHEARFMKLLIEQNEDGDRRRNAAKKKELEAAEKRIAELSAI